MRYFERKLFNKLLSCQRMILVCKIKSVDNMDEGFATFEVSHNNRIGLITVIKKVIFSDFTAG